MKKSVLILSMVLLCSFMMTAAPSYTAMVKVTITHDQGTNNDVLTLVEMPSVTLSQMNLLSTNKNINSGLPVNLNIYSLNDSVHTGRQSTLATTTLQYQFIGVAANQVATNYKFTFSNVSLAVGRNLYLYDLYLGTKTAVANSAFYEFTMSMADTINDRFMLGDDNIAFYYHRDVANGNWATVCFPYKFMDAAGVDKLYSLTAINSAGTKVAIDEVAITNVVAGKPYIFQSDSTAQEFKYKPENKAAAPAQVNGLNGVFADSTLTEQKWVITNNAVTPAASGSFVAQYRCFIDLGQTPVDDDAFTQQVPGRRIFNVKNTPTGMEMLEEVPAMQNGKMMIDGKLVIIKDGKMFNAQGMQL